MRPPNYTEADIIEAGTRLEEQQIPVTGYALKRVLGGGDYKRLKSVWQSHSSKDSFEHSPAPELPVELEESVNEIGCALSDQLRSLAIKLHETAVKSADRQVAEITRQYKGLEEQTEAELKDAAAIIEDLEVKNLSLENDLSIAVSERNEALAQGQDDRAAAVSMEAKLREMTGIEELVKRLKALEDRAEP